MQEESSADTFRDNNQFTLQTLLAASLVIAVTFLILGINFGEFAKKLEQDLEWWEVPVNQRHTLNLNLSGNRSVLPEVGPYGVLDYSTHFVEVDLPLSEQDAGYPEQAVMHVALWLPDVPEGVKVPVIRRGNAGGGR